MTLSLGKSQLAAASAWVITRLPFMESLGLAVISSIDQLYFFAIMATSFAMAVNCCCLQGVFQSCHMQQSEIATESVFRPKVCSLRPIS